MDYSIVVYHCKHLSYVSNLLYLLIFIIIIVIVTPLILLLLLQLVHQAVLFEVSIHNRFQIHYFGHCRAIFMTIFVKKIVIVISIVIMIKFIKHADRFIRNCATPVKIKAANYFSHLNIKYQVIRFRIAFLQNSTIFFIVYYFFFKYNSYFYCFFFSFFYFLNNKLI